MLPDIKGLIGLDIGCGEGSNTREIQRLGPKMTTIDISRTFIRYAKNLEERDKLGIIYLVASAVELPFNNNFFEFTMSTMALIDITEYQKVIQEGYRVTKPGGFFQFSITHPCFSFGVPEFIEDEEGHRKTIILSGYFKKRENQIDEWIFGAAPKKITEGLEKFRIPKFNYSLSE